MTFQEIKESLIERGFVRSGPDLECAPAHLNSREQISHTFEFRAFRKGDKIILVSTHEIPQVYVMAPNTDTREKFLRNFI